VGEPRSSSGIEISAALGGLAEPVFAAMLENAVRI
jgi:hypothetical protein